MSKKIPTGNLSTVNQLQASELIERTETIYQQGWNLPLSERPPGGVANIQQPVKAKSVRKTSAR